MPVGFLPFIFFLNKRKRKKNVFCAIFLTIKLLALFWLFKCTFFPSPPYSFDHSNLMVKLNTCFSRPKQKSFPMHAFAINGYVPSTLVLLLFIHYSFPFLLSSQFSCAQCLVGCLPPFLAFFALCFYFVSHPNLLPVLICTLPVCFMHKSLQSERKNAF